MIRRAKNEEELLRALDVMTAKRGETPKLAARLGIEPSHLRSMKSGSLPVSVKVADLLGYELRWIKKNGD